MRRAIMAAAVALGLVLGVLGGRWINPEAATAAPASGTFYACVSAAGDVGAIKFGSPPPSCNGTVYSWTAEAVEPPPTTTTTAPAATTTTRPPPTTTSTTPPPTGGPGEMFITAAELRAKPTSGPGWAFLRARADLASWGTVTLSNQDSFTQTNVLAGALVYARTGDGAYRTKVIGYLRQVCSASPGSALATGRTLYGYVVAADLVQMATSTQCTNGETWLHFLQRIRTQATPGNSRWTSLEVTAANTSSNWGAYALGSHLAVSYALNDTAAVARDLAIFRRYLGDTTSPAAPFVPTASYRYGGNGATWDATPTLRRGINPAGVGERSGALIEDALRGGSGGTDSVPCCAVTAAARGYQEETLDGLFSTAQLFRAHGVDVTSIADGALKRAFDFYRAHGASSYSVRFYLPYVINDWYGASNPASGDSVYRHMGFGSWLFS